MNASGYADESMEKKMNETSLIHGRSIIRPRVKFTKDDSMFSGEDKLSNIT